jgi:hypothetical protein
LTELGPENQNRRYAAPSSHIKKKFTAPFKNGLQRPRQYLQKELPPIFQLTKATATKPPQGGRAKKNSPPIAAQVPGEAKKARVN